MKMRLVSLFVSAAALAPAAAQFDVPSFSARLLAAHEAVAPGGQTEMAVVLEVEPEWHIYHPALHTGIPTAFEFVAPDGVSVGPVRFPTPHLDRLGEIEYLALDGRVVCFATLKVAASVAAGTPLEIKVKVSALACKESCLPVDAEATLSLPITAQTGKAANAELFKKARGKLPKSLGDAPYIQGSRVTVSHSKLPVGGEGEITVTIKVKPDHHIQDRDPGVEGLIASRLFIETIDGVKLAEQIWPKPHVREMPGLGAVREQSGDVVIRTPLKITDKKFKPGLVKLHVLFEYQCCTDSGSCYPPEWAEGSAEFEVVAAGSAAVISDGAAVGQADAAESAESGGGAAARQESSSLIVAMFLGFLGGLFLNVMPCVLPVISIKILGFVQQAGEDPRRVFRLGLAFCAGIMVWFWALAALMARGNLPLQYPWVVIGIGSVMVLFALNLFGVFEVILPGSAAGKLDAAASGEGYGGAFFKGLLATLLGTACTAPFLAGAMVYALTKPPLIVFLVFSAAGAGMSSPYFILSARPAWLKYVPKPGPWMVTFKQFAGFILLGTVVWLLWIVRGLLGGDGAVWTVAFWGFLGLAAWIYGKTNPTWDAGPRLAGQGAALLVAALGGWFSYGLMYEPPKSETVAVDLDAVLRYVAQHGWEEEIPWIPYQPRLAETLAGRGYTVYVDYTADWCPNCKWNLGTVLETDTVRARMRDLGVIPIEADFTKRDTAMWEEIRAFGRPTVPLNLIYPSGKPSEPIVLPVLLTRDRVLRDLAQAGPSEKKAELVRKVP